MGEPGQLGREGGLGVMSGGVAMEKREPEENGKVYRGGARGSEDFQAQANRRDGDWGGREDHCGFWFLVFFLDVWVSGENQLRQVQHGSWRSQHPRFLVKKVSDTRECLILLEKSIFVRTGDRWSFSFHVLYVGTTETSRSTGDK